MNTKEDPLSQSLHRLFTLVKKKATWKQTNKYDDLAFKTWAQHLQTLQLFRCNYRYIYARDDSACLQTDNDVRGKD